MSKLVNVKILLFATLRDRAGINKFELSIPEGTSILAVKEKVIALYPALEPLRSNMLASINQEFGYDEDLLHGGEEVAFFPAVSGGSEYPTILRISEEPFDTEDIFRQITLNSTGAIASFTGIIRGITTRGKQFNTVYLEYEAYVPMARQKMEQIASEIREQWPAVEGIAIIQRIGKLPAKTPTVLVACAAAHRDTGAFEAARYGIDRLKQIVPVWKKEIGPQGEEWIEGDYQPKKGD